MDLSIIIVNYKSKEYLKKCLDSIKHSSPKVSYEVIVRDNDKVNIGLSKGVNECRKKAKGKYILLLNPDTEVKKGSIDKLYQFAIKTPDAGAVAPALLDPDGKAQNSVYRFPSIFNAIRQYWFGEEGVYEKYSPKGEVPVPVDAAVMAAFLITPQALKKIGGLNEKYFLYYEDLDYCRNIKRVGLKTYYLPDAKVVHQHGVSGKSVADVDNQWRRLIPSSKIYNGVLKHNLLNFILWTGQKLGNLIPPLLLLLLSLPVIFSMLRPGFFPMQDDLQAFRVQQMDKCLDDLQIPCRWVPDAGYQYGYPQFNFYPPLPYYLGAGLHRVGIQYIDSVKILFVLGYLLSGLTFYLLVTEVLKSRWTGMMAALLYTYIPYKAVEVYVRGALSEFWAQIFFPLILWAIYKLIKSGKTKYLILFAVSLFFLATTHVLMTIIFVPVALVWAAFWLAQNKGKNVLKIIYGGLLGVGLSAFFLFPVALERQYVHTEGLLSGYFDYRQHFVNLYKLFISREWGYGSSGFPDEKLNLSLGLTQWIFGLIVTPLIALFTFRKNKKLGILTLILLGGALLTIFMIHMKSSFIWSQLPFLQYMQFPWRFLAVSIFILCVLSGVGIYLTGKYKYLVGIILVSLAFVLSINYFVPKAWLNITDRDKFSGESWDKQLTISIFDYLPIYATLPPWSAAPDYPEILKGDTEFISYKKGSNYQEGEVKVNEDGTLRLPLFDFPGMEVKVDGNKVPHINNNCEGERYCRGLITFDIDKGNHSIEARLTNTPVRTAGNAVTLISMALVIYLLIRSRNEKFLS